MPAPNHLPGPPNADIWDWQMHGLCRGVDSPCSSIPMANAVEHVPSAKPAQKRCAVSAGPDAVPQPRADRRRAVRHLGRNVGNRT